MHQEEAIAWLARELSKEHPGALVAVADEKEIRFKAGDTKDP